MHILLTGGSGLVGHNFLEHPSNGKFDILAPSSKELNLLDFSSIKVYLKKNQPDLIIHAAGQVGGIAANIKAPVRFFYENLEMGKNLILASYQVGIRKLINLGSSCMYPRNHMEPLTEDMVLRGELEPTNEGYAIAKIAATRFCEYIVKENPGFKYITLIPCNLYGRWDKFNPENAHLIPAVINKIYKATINNESKVSIWGDGTAKREFMYAGDLADCLVYTINNFEKAPLLMNVGTGLDYTITEYYQKIAKIIGYTGEFDYDLTKPAGMTRKLVSIDNATRFGWKSKISLADGIQKTYNFYLENFAEK